MLRARLALVIVFLCFVCLLALKAQPNLCSQDIMKRVNLLIGKAPSLEWLDCRLYTPTIEDYRICPSSTMKCFADEVKVLIEEWKAVGGIRTSNLNFQLMMFHQKLKALNNQTESECRQCERLTEQNAENFLRGLASTLQYINMQFC